MSKRGENIHKRKDGRWEGRYIKYRDVNGKIHYGSIYGKTYRETKEKLYRTLTNNQHSASISKSEKTFRDVLNMWLANNQIRLKRATVSKYRNLIETHILPELGDTKLSQLNASVINNFLTNKLQNGRLDGNGGLSASYVRSITLIINAAVNFAVDEELMPTLKSTINKPSIEKKELQILSLEEQKKLERYLSQETDSTAIGILISLNTGLRIGEVCALTWNDIDLANRVIHVRHTVARAKSFDDVTNKKFVLFVDTPKTKASVRDIPVTNNLYLVLKEKFPEESSKYIVSDKERFMNPRTFEYRYHRILEKCGIGHINYHILRHTFASRCIEAGVDVKSLSEILGHGNVSITLNTYVHSSLEQKRLQLEKLDSLY